MLWGGGGIGKQHCQKEQCKEYKRAYRRYQILIDDNNSGENRCSTAHHYAGQM